MTTSAFASFLERVVIAAEIARYRKHVRGAKKPPPKRSNNGTRHVATQKLLEAR